MQIKTLEGILVVDEAFSDENTPLAGLVGFVARQEFQGQSNSVLPANGSLV